MPQIFVIIDHLIAVSFYNLIFLSTELLKCNRCEELFDPLNIVTFVLYILHILAIINFS